MFTQIRKKQDGFTIVELLIVIVVIGILAALVLNTFGNIQARARDTERKTDVNGIHSQLEVYHADNGYYPILSDVTASNLSGLDAEALIDPSGVNVTAGSGDYVYAPTVSGGGACTTAGLCVSYTLTATMEQESNYVKNSLN